MATYALWMRLREQPRVLLVLWALWLLCALGLAFFIWVDVTLTGDYCELGQGTSIFGESEWSWSALSYSCTFDLGAEGIDLAGRKILHLEASGGRLGAAVALFLWAISLLILPRTSDRPTQRSATEAPGGTS